MLLKPALNLILRLRLNLFSWAEATKGETLGIMPLQDGHLIAIQGQVLLPMDKEKDFLEARVLKYND